MRKIFKQKLSIFFQPNNKIIQVNSNLGESDSFFKTLILKISLREVVTSIIALIVVGGTFILLWPALSTRPIDVTSAQAIFSILGGWGGIVIGFYFGSNSGEKIAKSAKLEAIESQKDKIKAKEITAETLENLRETIDETRKQVEKIERNKPVVVKKEGKELSEVKTAEKYESIVETLNSIIIQKQKNLLKLLDDFNKL